MKEFFFMTLFMVLLIYPLFSDEELNKANDYIAHCNFALGISFGIGGKIAGSQGLNITLVDRYNDVYNFNYNPDDDDSSILGFNITLSFPFYYQKYLSVGIYAQTLLNGLSKDDLTLYYGGGLYAEGIYKHYSLRTGLGIFGLNMSKSIGKVTPAWEGDPGYYTGSKFVKPGERLTASSYDFLGLSFYISFKYYPFKKTGFLGALYLQPGYYFFPSLEISEYKLNLGGKEITPPDSLPSFKIEPLHHISILVGIGL